MRRRKADPARKPVLLEQISPSFCARRIKLRRRLPRTYKALRLIFGDKAYVKAVPCGGVYIVTYRNRKIAFTSRGGLIAISTIDRVTTRGRSRAHSLPTSEHILELADKIRTLCI